ncbi:MAG: COX15/CtaA family protein, partial [Bacteroidota bacterium]
FVFLNMVFAFTFRKKMLWVPIVGILIFVLTGFQGWVGSIVVSTNLLHGFITFHMLLALVILALLIWINVRIKGLQPYVHKPLLIITILTLILFVPQIVLGTEVRGTVDDLLISTYGRSVWVNKLTEVFLIHRSYSWLILIGCVLIGYYARKTNESWLIKYSISLILLVFIAMIAGLGMVRFGFPYWLQPIHLIVAVGIFSILFYLTLRLKLSK